MGGGGRGRGGGENLLFPNTILFRHDSWMEKQTERRVRRSVPTVMLRKFIYVHSAKPEFVNVKGAQKSIPSNRLRQTMVPVWPQYQMGLSYRSTSLGIDSWAP